MYCTVGLLDEWCEAKSASRTSGVKDEGLQDVWCEAKSASRTSGVKFAGRVV